MAAHFAHTSADVAMLYYSQSMTDQDRAGTSTLGRSNYLAVGGMWGRGTNPGVLTNDGILTNRSQTRIAQVTDGTSHTLLVGEGLGGIVNGQVQYGAAWMGSSCALPTVGGMAPVNPHPFQFSSMHPGIVQFAFADGSVHGLRHGDTNLAPTWNALQAELQNPRLDWRTFQRLGGMRDGLEIPSNNGLLLP